MNEISTHISDHLDRARAADSSRGIRLRKARSHVYFTLAILGLALVAVPTLLIIGGVVKSALPSLSFSLLTVPTTGITGGLRNEILGTLLLTFGTAILAGFVGILSGLYLSSYAPSVLGNVLRTVFDLLAGVPSIVVGYVVYVALVVHYHWGFSLAAGLIAISVIIVPYIGKTTEVAIRQVPTPYIEGAEALGIKESTILRRLILKTALPGIATGMILAIAISIGETAPLLYTAGFSGQDPSLALTHSPVGYLTYVIWAFFNQPNASAVHLAWDAAFFLMVGVLLLIIISRAVVFASQRYSETGR